MSGVNWIILWQLILDWRQSCKMLDMARYRAENDQMCFLCFMSFCVFFKLKSKKKSKKGYCMIFASRRAEAYATFLVTTHRDCIRHTMCFCVFVFFFKSFFSNSTAPESRCVFVFLCFLTKNTKTQGPNFWLCFFQQ